MAILFRLWVLDTVGLTDVRRENLRNLIDRNLMTPLRAGDITFAGARAVGPDEVITAGRLDAVVFLTAIGFQEAGSMMKRAGVTPEEAMANKSVAGLTLARLPGGCIAEVYWNRCETLSGAAAAIFHEAGHLKFQEDFRDEMHNFVWSDSKTNLRPGGRANGCQPASQCR